MHTFSENSSGVPAFLAKLWRLVEDEETNNLIYWSAVSKVRFHWKTKARKKHKCKSKKRIQITSIQFKLNAQLGHFDDYIFGMLLLLPLLL